MTALRENTAATSLVTVPAEEAEIAVSRANIVHLELPHAGTKSENSSLLVSRVRNRLSSRLQFAVSWNLQLNGDARHSPFWEG